MTLERVDDGRRRVAAPPGQNFKDTLVQSLTNRFFLDELNVAGKETVTCEVVPFHLLASFMDPRSRDLSFLSEAERKALVDFASQGETVKDMPLASLHASSDVAVTTELEISPMPEKKFQVRISHGRVAWKRKILSLLSGIHRRRSGISRGKGKQGDLPTARRATNKIGGRSVRAVERK